MRRIGEWRHSYTCLGFGTRWRSVACRVRPVQTARCHNADDNQLIKLTSSALRRREELQANDVKWLTYRGAGWTHSLSVRQMLLVCNPPPARCGVTDPSGECVRLCAICIHATAQLGPCRASYGTHVTSVTRAHRLSGTPECLPCY